MASQALTHREIETLQATLLADVYAGAISAPCVYEARDFANEAESLFVSDAEGPKFLKGAIVAFGLEATGALMLYGVWQLWHILR
ncbi:MAG: hypothetical protein ABSE99_12240 [Terracidiphilus sp.]|jgi:hypothetical protein